MTSHQQSGDVLAVISQFACTATFIDVTAGVQLRTIELLAQPHEASFDAKRRLVYVTHTYVSGWYSSNGGRGSVISVIDADSRRVVDQIDLSPEVGPHDIHWDARNDLLFVVVEAGDDRTGALLMINPDSREVVHRVSLDVHGPHWFTVSPDSSTIFTANKKAPHVSVIDVATATETGRVAVPSSEGIAILNDGRRVIVAGPVLEAGPRTDVSGLRVIDVAQGAVVEVIESVEPLEAVHVTASGDLLVSEMPASVDSSNTFTLQDGMLRVYDGDTLQLRARLPIGAGALTIRSSPDGSLAFVTSLGSGSLDVIDLEKLTVLRTEEVGAGAHGLAVITPAP